MSSERSPLLRANTANNDDRVSRRISTASFYARQKRGPMDITPSNRRGILAGIWLATFLSVSRVANRPLRESVFLTRLFESP